MVSFREIPETASYLCRIRVLRLFAVSLLLCGLAGTAQGVEMTGLYRAEIVVENQSRQQRLTAYPRALLQVLTRVTGKRIESSDPGVQGILRSAVDYVAVFGYSEAPPLPPEPVTDTSAVPQLILPVPSRQLLQVDFDAVAVTAALRVAGLPVWGATRPGTLLWLAIEDSTDRYLLTEEQVALVDIVGRLSDQRGVPVLVPIMDIQDQQTLNWFDVWADFGAPIEQASARYAPDAVLVGRIARHGDQHWSSRWTLRQASNPAQWSVEGESLAAALEQGLRQAIDVLASRYAPLSGSHVSGRTLLRISSVDTYAEFSRVMNYLRGLASVTRVVPTRVEATEVLIEIEHSDAFFGLQQAIDLGATLQLVDVAADLILETDPVLQGVAAYYQLTN
ncbi:MAG TPA: DUF2066 domain-containing protein [Chromatiaceae bacterium]|nr:DUF2066 domain-containing protein [Chromatiaceae bacterium]HIA09050.1 DUF2066 domain-containing protein [Chromatiaceae bacterium]HIN81765.1 DUF2066 domain-containing protein [Chromatiales bacterium]HIO55049.1 DUF2066 domain-containing protein [Chromatiales bacterium]